MRSLARPFFMNNASYSYKQDNTYTIGIIVDQSIIIRKHIIVKRILSFITSKQFSLYHTVNIIIALRNSYECSIARNVIEKRLLHPNLKLFLLLSGHQINSHNKARLNASTTKYSDIIASTEGLSVIQTTFTSTFFRKSLEEISKNCDLIIYRLICDRHIRLLQSLIHNNNRTIHMLDIAYNNIINIS